LKSERRPRLSYQVDPIRASLKILGAKWSLIIIRDVAFLDLHRFGEIRRNNPGLTARVLSRRLRQMVAEGLLTRDEEEVVRYELTEKGEDAVYVLLALLRYGIRHHMKTGDDYELQDVIRDLHYKLPFDQ
jgi:DNA-binding HxlR family transcriptional regulator